MSASDPKLVERLRYKAADAAKRFIDWRFGNDNEPPRISIPARPDEDDDLVLVTTLKEAASALEAAEARIAALEAENGALREKVERAAEDERDRLYGIATLKGWINITDFLRENGGAVAAPIRQSLRASQGKEKQP